MILASIMALKQYWVVYVAYQTSEISPHFSL